MPQINFKMKANGKLSVENRFLKEALEQYAHEHQCTVEELTPTEVAQVTAKFNDCMMDNE